MNIRALLPSSPLPSLATTARWSLVGLCLTVLTGCIPIPVMSYSPSPVVAGEAVSFDGSETIVSTYPEDNAVVSYRWDFGDGSEARGSVVTHTYSAAGSYTVTLTVVDTAGREGSTSEDITVYAATSTLVDSSSTTTLVADAAGSTSDSTSDSDEDTVVVVK